MAEAIPTGVPPHTVTLPALSEHRIARFATIMVLYFLQGVPLGLTIIALPAWLAEGGASPIEVAGFVGFALIPWSTKLFNGLIMDRYTYKAMGRRRGWIMLAQGLMFAVLVTIAIIAPDRSDIVMLAGLCFALNLCVNISDVGVDGMVVDIVPEAERTTANSLMFACQVAGVSACSLIAGKLLASGSLASTAIVFAGLVGAASLFVSLFRERPGEKLLPWSNGRASPECEARQHAAWWPVLSGVVKASVAPRTLLFLSAYAAATAFMAYSDAVNPTLAVQRLGWTSEAYSSFMAGLTLGAAVCGLLLPTLLQRVFGLRGAILLQYCVLTLLAAAAGLTFDSWQGDLPFMAFSAAMFVLTTSMTISMIVWGMRLCHPAVAASQFALVMTVPNFARTFMGGNSGWLVEGIGYGATYFVVAGIFATGLVLMVLARVGDESGLPEAAQ